MAFATRAVDFANVDALLKAAELLEGTLNNRFIAIDGIEKTDSNISLRTDMYPHTHETNNGNHATNGKRDQLPKMSTKDQSVHSQHSHQEVLRVKSDKLAPLSTFCYSQKNAATMEQLERTLTASGYHFVKSDEELAIHNTAGPWIEQTNRMDRGRATSFAQLPSPNQCRIFTAASGLGHDLRPTVNAPIPLEDDPEGSSNTSEVEDSCLDNSSQDSFTGHHTVQAPHDSGIRRFLDSPSSSCDRNHLSSITGTTPNASHCRLRTALLNSPGQLHSVSSKTPVGILSGRAHTMQSFSSNGKSPRSPPTVNRSLVISRRTEHSTRPHSTKETLPSTPRTFSPSRDSNTPSWGSASNLPGLTESHRTALSHLSAPADNALVLMNPHMSVNRPPSAAPALRRMSSDSCVERTFSMQKSVSQPHSPDYQLRRASMPISPCRLPMKKRKFDWSQMSNEGLTKRADSSPCPVSEHSNFLSNGSTPSSAANASGGHSVQNPLVINCPTDRSVSHLLDGYSSGDIKASLVPLSAPPSVPPLARDHFGATDDEDLVDRRPHSIPSSLVSCSVTTPIGRAAQSTNTSSNSTSNILAECALQKTLDNLAAVLSSPSSEGLRNLPTTSSGSLNGSNGFDYSQLSLLMKTLTASSLASGSSNSNPIVSQSQQMLSSMLCAKSEAQSVPSSREFTSLISPTAKHVGTPGSVGTGFNPTCSQGAANSDLASARPTGASSASRLPAHRHAAVHRNRITDSCAKSVTESTVSTQDRVTSSSGFLQPDERLSGLTPENRIPRQSFKVRRWFEADSGSRRLVTDSCTVTPTPPPPVTIADGWPLQSNSHQFHTHRGPQPTLPSGGDLMQSGPQMQELRDQAPHVDSRVSEAALPNAEGSSVREPRVYPPSKLIIDSRPRPQTNDSASSSPSPNADSAIGAQILMMLSPSEHNKTTHTAFDPSLARALQSALGGKSASKFPLLLVSATSSASAAALAAAAAMATGAPPTSLVPVPVQVRTYMPKDGSDQRNQTLQPDRADGNGYSDELNGPPTSAQRIVLSFCPQDKDLDNESLDKRFSVLLSTSRSISNSVGNNPKVDSNLTSSIGSEASRIPLLQSTAMTHSN